MACSGRCSTIASASPISAAAPIEGYQRVNRIFAEKLAPLLQPDDVIWVHDYHFMPLAAELRALGVRNRIGFFLHIPFPAPELLLTLPVPSQAGRRSLRL